MSSGKVSKNRFFLGRVGTGWYDESLKALTKRVEEANKTNTLPGRSFRIKTIHYRDNHVGLYFHEQWTYGT